jgi:SAM-dependent methyltransferase
MPWITSRTGLGAYAPCTTVQYDAPIKRTLARLPENSRIGDVGAGGRRITAGVVTIDRLTGPETDVSCDIHDIPLPDASFDCIFCTGTLEHVEDPNRVLGELHRLLCPGGIVHLEVPFLQGYHADPDDFWRWTLPGLELMCRRHGFEPIESGTHIGPTSAINWIVVHYVAGLLPGRLGSATSYALRFLLRPFLIMDRLWRRNPYSATIASGVYFVGRKR